MHRSKARVSPIKIVIVTAAVVIALGLREQAAMQSGNLSTARVTHIGVVVKDMDAAVRDYVRVMGFPPPKINAYPIPLPDGRKAEFKTATLYMPNFFIEVIQPTSNVGPFYEHLQAHGTGIQHMGLHVPGEGPIDEVRAALEQNGGRWTLGSKGVAYAYVDFPTLGTNIEVNRGAGGAAGNQPPAIPAGDALPPLAALNVTHVGFGAADTAKATSELAKTLGISAPKVNEYKDSQYPPNSKWNASAYLRLASWSQGGIGLEFIESVGGPTPWSEFVKSQKGTAPQHIAINVGNRMDEMIRDLQAKGGKWTNGKQGGGYAYLDFQDTLGLVFELNGTSKSATK